MTLVELAKLCIDAHRRRGSEATVTLKLPGPVCGARARLWPGPLAEMLCVNEIADGQLFRVCRFGRRWCLRRSWRWRWDRRPGRNSVHALSPEEVPYERSSP